MKHICLEWIITHRQHIQMFFFELKLILVVRNRSAACLSSYTNCDVSLETRTVLIISTRA